jgi:glycerol-3-phosphate cytidylyltransferase
MTQTIHVRFLSEEYVDRDFTGKQYCIDNNIELVYHPRKHQYSSSELRERVFQLESTKKKDKEQSTIQQHSPTLLANKK